MFAGIFLKGKMQPGLGFRDMCVCVCLPTVAKLMFFFVFFQVGLTDGQG